MLVQTLPLPTPTETAASSPLIIITAKPLTRASFAAFGDAIENPRPGLTPSGLSTGAAGSHALEPPPDGFSSSRITAASANQGSAIQYRGIGDLTEHYAQAPSGEVGRPRLSMFVCAARKLVAAAPVEREGKGEGEGDERDRDREGEEKKAANHIRLEVLERHPFTSQTFIPLTADESKRYLVVVAPTLEASDDGEDRGLPVPVPNPVSSSPVPVSKEEHKEERNLPGPGWPDLTNLKAFIARGDQAVTYAAGTWHAPMMALGPEGSTVDFVVVQFVNDVALEDCQEVGIGGLEVVEEGEGEDKEGKEGKEKGVGIWVRVPRNDEEETEKEKETGMGMGMGGKGLARL